MHRVAVVETAERGGGCFFIAEEVAEVVVKGRSAVLLMFHRLSVIIVEIRRIRIK